MLASVFRNLLNNAVQHNDTDAPEVTVTCEETDDRIRVRVADNGPGVPDAEKDEIFGKGEKGLDSAGSGIGLYLVSVLTPAVRRRRVGRGQRAARRRLRRRALESRGQRGRRPASGVRRIDGFGRAAGSMTLTGTTVV